MTGIFLPPCRVLFPSLQVARPHLGVEELPENWKYVEAPGMAGNQPLHLTFALGSVRKAGREFRNKEGKKKIKMRGKSRQSRTSVKGEDTAVGGGEGSLSPQSA